MKFNDPDVRKIVRNTTIAIIIYLLGFGCAMALFPIKPFWNDEWRLIYNLKFKSGAYIWGSFDFLQQFPRVYFIALKDICSFFNYSYISLRLPSLVMGVFSVLLALDVHAKLYPEKPARSYLFILILISSQTFTDYLVQVKQYEMEIFLSLLALWQLITLLKIPENLAGNRFVYFLLCVSFLIAPFFSYTYPIAIAPIFPVMLYKGRQLWNTGNRLSDKGFNLALIFFPLFLATISICIFYYIDISQLMADKNMYDYWATDRMTSRSNIMQVISHFWGLFSVVGSGFAFEIIFGMLGIIALFFAIIAVCKHRHATGTHHNLYLYYCILLIAITVMLYLSGKLPLGTARFTAYTVPAISILIIYLLDGINRWPVGVITSKWISVLLFAGLYCNIISTCINTFTVAEYKKNMDIYASTTAAIIKARKDKVPIIISEGIYGDPTESGTDEWTITDGVPYKQHGTPLEIMHPEIVLQVMPEFRPDDSFRVYSVHTIKSISQNIGKLPAEIKTALVGDGILFTKINR